MSTIAITLADGTAVSITGTKPFAKRVTGMNSSELEVFSTDNTRAEVRLHGQAATTVYANTGPNNAIVDEIVTKANA